MYVVNERIVQYRFSRMTKYTRKAPQYGQIGGAFQVQYDPFDFGLIILVEADFFQRLEYLAATIVNAMRLADEGDNNVLVGGLVQHDLRVAGGDYLGSCPDRCLSQKVVNLPLP